MSIGLIGKKLGMTRIYDAKGNLTPVTVIAAGGNVVLQRKTVERDGYAALQVGFDTQKEQRVSKPQLGHFKKAGAEAKKCVREFRTPDAQTAGDDANLNVTQFEVGQFVDVCGQSKGKGFQGVMRKHNFHGQGAAHGSKTHRRNGAIGCRSTPGRIFKNQGMPGHMGDERKTVQNLTVEAVRESDNVILVKGAVPGANGSYVIVRPATKQLARIAAGTDKKAAEPEKKAASPAKKK